MSPASAAPEIGSGDESIQTILVVEDEVLIRLPLAEYLRECGYRVFEASNVAEAKAVLDADTPVDLVFSDVNMPGNENGFALAVWIRQRHPESAPRRLTLSVPWFSQAVPHRCRQPGTPATRSATL
jgi:CheY-like chemotaxis protein